MIRFKGFEGARGWLAWSVVVSHLAQLTGVTANFHQLAALQKLGDISVQVFIIMSGFVIYHLIITRREKYLPYLTRRFMRLYPVYIVCLLLGMLVTALAFRTLPSQPWGDALVASPRLFLQMASAASNNYYLHTLAHLTLLHGAIPTDVLYESQYFFLPPAWSLSLEWQFYIIAPLVALAARHNLGRIALILATAACYYLDSQGAFGSFILPSFLPSAAFLFGIGIATRMCIPVVKTRCHLTLLNAAIVLGLGALGGTAFLPIAAWALLVLYSVSSNETKGINTFLLTAMERLLDSRFAVGMGERSYAVYISHFPVIQAGVCIAALTQLSYPTMVIAVVAASPIAIIGISELLHVYVEKPGIQLGHRAAKRFGSTPKIGEMQASQIPS